MKNGPTLKTVLMLLAAALKPTRHTLWQLIIGAAIALALYVLFERYPC